MSHQKTTDEAGPSQTGVSPSYTTSQSHKIKNKGKYPTKGPIKRKVKEYRLRVVGCVLRHQVTSWCYEGFKDEECMGEGELIR